MKTLSKMSLFKFSKTEYNRTWYIIETDHTILISGARAVLEGGGEGMPGAGSFVF